MPLRDASSPITPERVVFTPLSPAPEAASLLRKLREFFAKEGVTAYAVGGAIRDSLLGRPRTDIDLAVAGSLAQLMPAAGDAVGASVVKLDAARHMYRLVPRPLRDQHGLDSADEAARFIDIGPLRGGTIEADALQRDFTVNALAAPLEALDVETGEARIIDPTGGLDDLRERRVRAVRPNVFIDDPLRLLRAVRLAAELGFSIEEGTLALARRDAQLLGRVSGERVRDELCRILAAPGAAHSLRIMDDLGLLTVVIPELEESRDVAQPREHYWDVLQHSIETVGFMEQVLRQGSPSPQSSPLKGEEAEGVLDRVPWDEELEAHFRQKVADERTRLALAKLGALLHDVAKAATKSIEPDGRIRFLGHPVQGAGMTTGVMERLRFSNREIRLVSVMVNEHLRPGLISRGEHEPTRRAMYRFFRDAGEAAIDTLFLSFADYLAARGPRLEAEDWDRYSGKVRLLLEEYRGQSAARTPVKLINGHDLMRTFNLPPGPHLRVLLEAVSEAHAAGEIATREEALALARQLIDTPQVTHAGAKTHTGESLCA